MQYLTFFNLNEDPFRLTPDPFFYYPSQEHDEILQSLNYAIEQKEGFFLAMGEPGTGKTTTLKVFIEAWRDKADIALIMTPRLSPEEFLMAVLDDFGVEHFAASKNEMIKAFRDFLIRSSEQSRRVVIIVDEAQNLPTDTLEELRLLSNLETEKEKLLQIVLVGQPELGPRIMSDNMRQLRQRITVSTSLRPLSADETIDYINYRLIKAGRGNAVFDDSAKKMIHSITSGVPRLVNMYSSRAMMAAYLEGSRRITKKHVKLAEKHFSHTAGSVSRFRIAWALVVIFAVAVVSAGAYRFYSMNYGSISQKVAFMQKQVQPEQADIHKSSSAVVAEPVQPQPDPPKIPKILVNVKSATLRAAPSIDAKPVAWASEGVFFELIESVEDSKSRKWHMVRLSDGETAWIAASIVKQAD